MIPGLCDEDYAEADAERQSVAEPEPVFDFAPGLGPLQLMRGPGAATVAPAPVPRRVQQ